MKKIVYRMISVLLTVIMIAGMMTATAFAKDIDDRIGGQQVGSDMYSTYGDWRYINREDGVIITGYRAEESKDRVTVPSIINGTPVVSIDMLWSWGYTTVKSLTIPSSVTNIKSGEFNECLGLESVELGDGISQLAPYTFQDCGSLKSVKLGDKVEEIPSYTFYNCRKLSKVTLGNAVKRIYEAAFTNCPSIESLKLPASTESVDPRLFGKGSGLSSSPAFVRYEVAPGNPVFSVQDGVLYSKDMKTLISYPCGKGGDYTAPSSIAELAPGAFYYCDNIGTVTLPDSVKSISDYAFAGCEAENFDFKGSINEIGRFAFYSSSIDHIVNGPKTVSYGTYSGCMKLKQVQIPDTVEIVEGEAFAGCQFLSEVQIPSSVRGIGTKAFEDCYQLNVLNIEEGVKYIGDQAFNNNFALIWLPLPRSVEEIGSGAVSGRTGIIGYKNSYAESYARENDITFKERTGAFSTKISLDDVEITLSPETVEYKTYDNRTTLPNPELRDNGTLLWRDWSYSLAYENAENAGTGTVVITGEGIYEGTRRINYTITPRGTETLRPALETDEFTYTGSEICPEVSVTDIMMMSVGNKRIPLEEGKDFTVTYKNNVDIGTATAVIKCKGNYTGTMELYYEITGESLSKADISLSSYNYTYDGTEKRPAVTVEFEDHVMTEGADYEVEYKDNINAGSAKVRVIGKANLGGSKDLTFTISPKSIRGCTITPETNSFIYDGKPKTPGVMVRDGSVALKQDTDYTVSYSNNIDPGTATVTVTGKGNYQGSLPQTFTIKNVVKDIAGCTLKLGEYNNTYTGSAIRPPVTLNYGSTTLRENTDYTLSYSDNINAGLGTIIITGKGTYSGTVKKTFVINARQISFSDVNLSSRTFTYNGTEKRPDVTITYDGKQLIKDKDYTLIYSDNINVGNATVKVTMIGNYTNTIIKSFRINGVSFDDAQITVSPSSYVYDGSAKKPGVSVRLNNTLLKENTDYTLSYSNNIKPGNAKVTVTPKGNYTGTALTRTFSITGIPLYPSMVSLSQTSYTYDGSAKKPSVTVENGTTTLKSGTDYTVSYKDNINAGTATVTVTGIGLYANAADKYFTISRKDLSNAAIKLSPTSYTFDGYEKEPSPTVTLDGKTLEENTDYTVQYSNNIRPGNGVVTIVGKGNYVGNSSQTFLIKDKKMQFEWGSSNWSFINAYGVFPYNTKRINLMTASDINTLKRELTNTEYARVFGNNENGYLYTNWSGSCYGMSALMMVAAAGYMPYADYTSGAKTLHDIGWPTNNAKLMSLIVYYHMLQKTDIRQNGYITTLTEGRENTIKRLISNVEQYGMALVCFSQGNYYGHAVVAYGCGNQSYDKWNNKTFDRCIYIADPNSYNVNADRHLYYNSSTYDWIIPDYSNDIGQVASSYTDGLISYVCPFVDDINDKGLLKTKVNSSLNAAKLSSSYISTLHLDACDDDLKVSKVMGYKGNFFAPDMEAPEGEDGSDIVKSSLITYNGEGDATPAYLLYDARSSYSARQDIGEMDLTLDYPDSAVSVKSSNANTAIFSENGVAQVRGIDMDYTLSLTANDDYPTDWFTLSVEGENASSAKLEQVEEGYILTADNLNDVKVEAHNKYIKAHTTFSSSANSVLIYEIDENTIGIRQDNDRDGVYDDEVSTGTRSLTGYKVDLRSRVAAYSGETVKPQMTVTNGSVTLTEGQDYTVSISNNVDEGTAFVDVYGINGYSGTLNTSFYIQKDHQLGDVNGDKAVTAADRALLARYVAKWKNTEIYDTAADVNLDGTINALDRIILTRYVSDRSGYTDLPAN